MVRLRTCLITVKLTPIESKNLECVTEGVDIGCERFRLSMDGTLGRVPHILLTGSVWETLWESGLQMKTPLQPGALKLGRLFTKTL